MNEDIVNRYKAILDGISTDSPTKTLRLGGGLEAAEMMRTKTMDLKQLEAENEELRRSLAAAGFESRSTASMYRPGTEKFKQLWPFDPRMPMDIPFDEQDRETQFYSLSAAWSGRRAEGHAAMHAGNLDEAETIFLECLARADQMDVDYLRAESYVCLSYVAMRRGDATAQRAMLLQARQAYERDQTTS